MNEYEFLVLLQSIVFQAKDHQDVSENLIEAARDVTKYSTRNTFFLVY
jgi:hypothetical protein